MKASKLFSRLSFGMSISVTDMKTCLLAIKKLEDENKLLRTEKKALNHRLTELSSAHEAAVATNHRTSSAVQVLSNTVTRISGLFTELRKHHVSNFATRSEFIGKTDVHPNWHAMTQTLNDAQGVIEPCYGGNNTTGEPNAPTTEHSDAE